MNVAKTFKVQVEADHIKRVASGSPKAGLIELIWNALDADAKSVRVDFLEGELGVNRVRIADDGTGIPYEEAENRFVGLGGSWKNPGIKTKAGRVLHGQEGKGRFKAFTIGRIADWEVVYQEGDHFFEYTIEGNASAIDEFALSEKRPSKRTKTGVSVTISELPKISAIFEPKRAVEELAPVFAVYLKNYRSIKLDIGGTLVDPAAVIKGISTFDLDPISSEDGKHHPVALEIVEWQSIKEREIWFADSNNVPLESYEKQIRNVGDVGFSAFIKSDHFRTLNNQGLLALRDLEKSITDCCEQAVSRVKEFFHNKELEDARKQIREWQEQKVYPYKTEPTSVIEQAERKVFDIVATQVNKSLPSFQSSDSKSKQFQLRMLRHAIEKNPEELKTILSEVIRLPKKERDALASLLEDTSLSSIINTSSMVTDRLKFLVALEQLVFDFTKNVKERSQLHRLLARNTWVFGETYNLAIDDQSLTAVLRKHRELLGDGTAIDEPAVNRLDGTSGIVDLMLSRLVARSRADEVEHLVVELKRPSVDIKKNELDQIESYAFAVSEDERFRALKARWEFWTVAKDYDNYVKRKMDDQRLSNGAVYQTGPSADIDITIRVKTWAELIAACRHRHEFLRRKLEINISQDQALDHLKERYSQYIEGVLPETSDPSQG
nr:ATP-binding protein [Oceanococcus sp. HetDA_MAG_MS8]